MDRDFLTLQQVADYFQLSEGYIYKLTSQKKIKHYKPFGKMLYFKMEDLQGLMNESVVEVDTTDERIKEAADWHYLKKGGIR